MDPSWLTSPTPSRCSTAVAPNSWSLCRRVTAETLRVLRDDILNHPISSEFDQLDKLTFLVGG